MKKFRFFCGFLNLQERWLNSMSKKGWHLVKISNYLYEFMPCEPEEYEYCVECILTLKNKEANQYINFLHEMGYSTFQTGVNLNLSMGKIKWRPGGSVLGHVDTGLGKLNKEFLLWREKRRQENLNFIPPKKTG